MGEPLGLSWDEIHGIIERAVERGLKRRVENIITYLQHRVANAASESINCT